MNENEQSKKVEENLIDGIDKNLNNKDKKFRIYKGLFFVITAIYALIIRFNQLSITIELGDFGSVLPLLFTIIADKGFVWTPIFSVVGIVSLFLEKKIGKFSNTMITIISVVLIVSTLVIIIF